MIKTLGGCLFVLLLVSCQTTPPVHILVLPVVPKLNDAVPILLKGKIIFDGKEEYIPRTIGSIDARQDGMTIRYEYEDVHDRHETRIPFYLLGDVQPSGVKTATVFGRLTVLNGEKVVKRYEAIAALSTPSERGQTLTELRKLGLLAVRDSIEGQMSRDSEYLLGLKE